MAKHPDPEGGPRSLFERDAEGHYVARGEFTDADILALARDILERRMASQPIDEFDDVPSLLNAWIGHLEYEVFVAIWIDKDAHLISTQELFRGTINTSALYPREVAREALQVGASYVVFAHNHPFGDLNPSDADIEMTRQLKNTLALFRIPVLDHIIVTGNNAVSLRSEGLM